MPTRRFAPRAASATCYTRSQGIVNKMHMNEAWTERSMVLGANWRLANAKSSMVHEKNPDAVHGRCRKDGDKEQRTGNITPTNLICEWLQWLHIFVGQADFGFFVCFENTASCTNARRHTCWLEPTLSARLRCRALIGAYLLSCSCGLTALCCAVLRCACGAKKAKKFRKVPQQVILSSAITG